MAAQRAAGAASIRPYALAMLAEASKQEPEAGLEALAEALTLVDATEERWWEGELYRCKGELLLRQLGPDAQEAEGCLHQALDIARRQEATSLELRAAMSLARLWQQQGKQAEAYALLAPIYGWFTEGFDTADLQEAKALLDELGA
jgi:predicted ATPase